METKTFFVNKKQPNLFQGNNGSARRASIVKWTGLVVLHNYNVLGIFVHCGIAILARNPVRALKLSKILFQLYRKGRSPFWHSILM